MVMPGLKKPVDMGDWEMCISEKNVIPIPGADLPSCKITKKEISGCSVTFDITTDIGGQKTRYQGKVAYQGGSVKGEYTAQPSTGPKLDLKMSGKRLAQCKCRVLRFLFALWKGGTLGWPFPQDRP